MTFESKEHKTAMDLSIFTTPEAWISLVTLIFLEIVLGIDNLVFISITTNRLPEEKQHIGRKLGLAGALIMRVIFLCFASYLVHMTNPIFTLDLGSYNHGFSVRDIVLLLGGAYLIYKGITEVIDMLRLTEVKAAHYEEHRAIHTLTLPKAVATIMVMDIVFSIDSVITAVGMADHLIIMIIAVMIAVFMMMIFIDPISNFINGHPEMKLLALTFIVAIGCLLVMDSLGFHTGIELIHMPLEKLIVYFAMVFCIVLELIQMRYNKSLKQYHKEHWQAETAQRQGIPERYAAHGQQHNQRADDKTAVAAHGKDAQTHALVITGNKVGITRAFGMEDGPADAAEHERGEDGPVGVKKADRRQPEAGQQDAQRNEPAAREFVGYKSENRLNDGGHGRIGKGQRAAGLIIEIVGGCQIRKQGRQGPAVDVAGEMSQRYQKNFFELHAGRILCENDENSNAAGKAAPAASVVA